MTATDPAAAMRDAVARHYLEAASQRHAGMCPASILEGCDALWGAEPVVIPAGGTAQVTFPTQGVYFDEIAPVALITTVHSAGGNAARDGTTNAFTQTLRDCAFNCLVSVESIFYQGAERLASKTRVNLGTFACCNVHLGLACLGPIRVSSNDVTVTYRNEIDPANPGNLDLHVQAAIVGLEVRSGSLATRWGNVPCDARGIEEWCAKNGKPWLPPGSSGRVEVKASYTARPSGNGGGSMPPVP